MPIAAVVVFLARHIPETKDEDAPQHSDVPGVICAVLGLGALTAGLTEGSVPVALVGVALLLAFVVRESRSPAPMLPWNFPWLIEHADWSTPGAPNGVYLIDSDGTQIPMLNAYPGEHAGACLS